MGAASTTQLYAERHRDRRMRTGRRRLHAMSLMVADMGPKQACVNRQQCCVLSANRIEDAANGAAHGTFGSNLTNLDHEHSVHPAARTGFAHGDTQGLRSA